MKVIDNFRGNYGFLSNFYEVPVVHEGIEYTNNESAFQAAKLLDLNKRQQFTLMRGVLAKSTGRRVELRRDWEDVKKAVLYDICFDKFTRHLDLKESLLNTGNAMLIERNMWHDNFYGDCQCEKCKDIVGQNVLGEILTIIRKQIKENEE
jgi:ribA/ribD-fused uncharacterized protein